MAVESGPRVVLGTHPPRRRHRSPHRGLKNAEPVSVITPSAMSSSTVTRCDASAPPSSSSLRSPWRDLRLRMRGARLVPPDPTPSVAAAPQLPHPKPARSRGTTRRRRRRALATRGRRPRRQPLPRFGPSPRAPPERQARRGMAPSRREPDRRRTWSSRSPCRRRRERPSCRAHWCGRVRSASEPHVVRVRGRSRSLTAANSFAFTPAAAMTFSFRTRTPPSPIAPMASSGWNGTPSFRTRITSRGAPRSAATSYATGTPPRGRPSTTTGSSRRCCSRHARRCPASTRSMNGTSSPLSHTRASTPPSRNGALGIGAKASGTRPLPVLPIPSARGSFGAVSRARFPDGSKRRGRRAEARSGRRRQRAASLTCSRRTRRDRRGGASNPTRCRTNPAP